MSDDLASKIIDLEVQVSPEKFYANGEFVWGGTD